jgi:hypothetical protein
MYRATLFLSDARPLPVELPGGSRLMRRPDPCESDGARRALRADLDYRALCPSILVPPVALALENNRTVRCTARAIERDLIRTAGSGGSDACRSSDAFTTAVAEQN